MTGSSFERNDPALGFEYLKVEIQKLPNYGTGKYTCITKPNALAVPFPITCAATSKPFFQILLSIFPTTNETLVLLGRVDNTPPLSSKIYQLPPKMDFSRPHIFSVMFSNWNIVSLTLDNHIIQVKSLPEHHSSSAERYIQDLNQIARAYQHQGDEPLVEQVHPVSGPPISFLYTQKKIIEELFGNDWLANPSSIAKQHPAYKRWVLCNNLLNSGGNIPIAGNNENLLELINMLADNQFFVVCTKGRFENFSIGSIANYGDAKVQKRLNGVISNPSQYEDVITELSFAASQITRNHKVTVFEDPGFPDFSVSIPGWQLPFVADCKRIKKDSSESRIAAAIKNANKQVKAFNEPCYGLVVLDVSDKVGKSYELSDKLPMEIKSIRKTVAKAISKVNTSISAVVLLWDDYAILGNPRLGDRVITIWLRRKFEIIQHTKPQTPLNGDLESISVGNTVMIALKVKSEDALLFPTVWRPI